MITFLEYQIEAAKTAIYPNRGSNLVYAVLGLCGEAGEVANKVKKIQRDHGGVMTREMRAAIIKELGDVLWYLSACCDELGYGLNGVADHNLDNLKARAEKSTLTGSGDNR